MHKITIIFSKPSSRTTEWTGTLIPLHPFFMKVCIIIIWPRKPCLIIAFGLKSPQYLSIRWALWTLWPEQVFLCFFDAVKVSYIQVTTVPNYNQSMYIFAVNNMYVLWKEKPPLIQLWYRSWCVGWYLYGHQMLLKKASVFLQSV